MLPVSRLLIHASLCTQTTKNLVTQHQIHPKVTVSYFYVAQINGLTPQYLSNYIKHIVDSNRHHLRRWRSCIFGGWNSLPPHVTSAPTLTVFGNCLHSRSFPNCFLFFSIVLYTVYSSGLAVLYMYIPVHVHSCTF